MAVKRAFLEGLGTVKGSFRLVIMRWTLWILAGTPGVLIGLGALGDTVGRRPYFTEAADPLPVFELVRLAGAIPGAVWGALTAGVVGAWLGNLLLTAGAVEVLGRTRETKVRVWRTVFETGTRTFWVYLRLALLGAVLIFGGAKLLGVIFDRLVDHGAAAGWTGQSLARTVPLVHGVLLLTWATLVGVMIWWCKVITVADERRLVRRLPLMVLRLWWRRPLQGVVFHVVLSVVTLFASAAVLFGWRQSAAGPAGWIVLWLVVLGVMAFVWHWRLRACCLVWVGADLQDLQDQPDEPWHLTGRLWRRVRRRSADATVEAA